MEIEKRYGKDMTVEEVVKEICKDEIFFFHSGGGVTISGGEVLMQADFAKEILISYMEQGIPTAIENSLYSSYDNHRLGLETYERLGRVYELKDVEIPDMEMLKKMAEVIRAEDPETAVKVKGE